MHFIVNTSPPPQEINVCFLQSKNPPKVQLYFKCSTSAAENEIFLCSGTNHGYSQIHKTALTILWKLSLTDFKNRSERNHWPEVFDLSLGVFVVLTGYYLLLPVFLITKTNLQLVAAVTCKEMLVQVIFCPLQQLLF